MIEKIFDRLQETIHRIYFLKFIALTKNPQTNEIIHFSRRSSSVCVAFLVPGCASIMSSVTKYKVARVFLASPFIFSPADGTKKAQRGIIIWTKLKKIIGQLNSIRLHFTFFCAAFMEIANEKGQEISSVRCARTRVCVYVSVRVCACPYLPVNRTLIALALQLVDFHSKENVGINKDGIFKVLKCVIICEFELEKFALVWKKGKVKASMASA